MNPSIRPVRLDDVIGLDRYEKDRDEIRRRTIALKKHRRIPVGDRVTFVFENHATVFFQVHEMLRAERITDLDAVREELEVYNAMLPAPGGLSATMLIEITDQDQVEARLRELLGIDECLQLHVGDEHFDGQFEPGRSREDRLSAVQYVRFALSSPAVAAFADDRAVIRLCIDHENYRHATSIEGEVRRSLAADLASAR
jgi:hypothetical protein